MRLHPLSGTFRLWFLLRSGEFNVLRELQEPVELMAGSSNTSPWSQNRHRCLEEELRDLEMGRVIEAVVPSELLALVRSWWTAAKKLALNTAIVLKQQAPEEVILMTRLQQNQDGLQE